MSFLRRLFEKRVIEDSALDLRERQWHWYDIPPHGSVKVAGPQHHLDNLGRLFRAGREPINEDVTATLVREPDNPYDRHAVAVKIDGLLVGYIPHESSAAWSRYLAALEGRGYRARATLNVYYRWDKREYQTPNVYLTLRAREEADYRMPEELAAIEAERERAAGEKAAAKAARLERKAEREAQLAQAAAWRAAGLCVDCGAPVDPPAVRCPTHRHHGPK